jgi:hypothetical protein
VQRIRCLKSMATGENRARQTKRFRQDEFDPGRFGRPPGFWAYWAYKNIPVTGGKVRRQAAKVENTGSAEGGRVNSDGAFDDAS